MKHQMKHRMHKEILTREQVLLLPLLAQFKTDWETVKRYFLGEVPKVMRSLVILH